MRKRITPASRRQRDEQSRFGRIKLRLRRPLRELTFDVLQDVPGNVGLFLALEPRRETFVIPLPEVPGGDGGVSAQPIPPHELRLGYGSDERDYVESGRGNLLEFLSIIGDTQWSLEPHHRVLDFGCGAGRMTRWVPEREGPGEIWGVDISAACIQWATDHLSPPARFCMTTTLPHLPFEDRYFDLILGASVFTGIANTDHAWLLELRRILRPAGRACFSVLDKHALELVRRAATDDGLGGELGAFMNSPDILPMSSSNFAKLVVHQSLKGRVCFIDLDYLRQTWGQFFEILLVREEGHAYETVVVLTRD